MKKISAGSARSLGLPDFLLFIFLSILLGCKAALLYADLSLDSFGFPLAVATAMIFFALYALAALLSPKFARIFSLTIYVLLSCFMAIDGVYYAYMAKLPSAGLLSLLGQAKDIQNSIANLVQVKHLLQLMDLPFLLIIRINRDLLAVKWQRSRLAGWYTHLHQAQLSRTRPALVALPAALLVTGFLAVYPDFEAAYMSNELFCYHTADIARTISASQDSREVDKSRYASPDWSDSEFYGLAEGRNVFIIQVEAMQNFVIGRSYEGQELTPHLNAMIGKDTFYFDQYAYQVGGGNTSDAEFAVNNSLFAPEEAAAYVKYPFNTYHGLPFLLKDNGYSGAHVFHAYHRSFWNRETAYPAQGFDSYMSLENMEMIEPFAMGISDAEMFRQSMEELKTYEEPFYSFYITLSSHYPYALPLDKRFIQLLPEDEQTLFGFYMQAMNYTDYAIGLFMEQLKEAGLYDNSIFILYGDHYALSNTDAHNMERVSDLLGRPYSIFDVFNVPLIIHIPGMDRTEVLHTAGGHMDVLPTLLCLLGIHNDQTVMFGQNLLEAEHGLVCEQTHVAIGSFISDDVFFSKPHNNIKSHYDAYARGTMERLDPELFMEQSQICADRIADCAALLHRNDIFLHPQE